MTPAEPAHEVPRLPPRPPDSHKGTYGRVLIFAGSPGMAGAAVLTAKGALRAGAGLVTLAVPASLSTVCATAVPEATTRLLPEPGAPGYSGRLAADLEGALDGHYQAVAIGPGLGTSPASRELVSFVLSRHRGPQVVDADGLNLVAAGVGAPRSDERVWTPHPGELQRLAGTSPRGDAERIEAARDLATARGGVFLLKGHRTVAHDGTRCYLNLTGNPGMATGGSGDVLTGVIAALLGQGLDAFSAACLGAYIHGLAGDIAARDFTAVSMTALDLAERLPQAFARHARYAGRT